MRPRYDQQARGFVLVNALVLVAALASVAVFLLARADAGRTRLEAGLGAAQLTRNLEAFEALAITLLSQDSGAVDHPGEGWARAGTDVPLERGRVGGRIADLQGRFNLNWLSDTGNSAAHAAFDRLLTRLGVSERSGALIRAALAPDGPPDPAAWQRLIPPETPVGGALLMADQLFHIPGLSPRALVRLRPFVTALPGDSALNVNTVSAEVLAAFLPGMPAATLNRLLRDRGETPFTSVDAFLITAGIPTSATPVPGAPPPPLEADRLSVGSDWFRAEIRASLEGQTATRSVVLHRQGVPARVTPAWRISLRP